MRESELTPGATVPELDTDVGTGTEGDVEARCFSKSSYSACDSCLLDAFERAVVDMQGGEQG